MKRLLLCRGMGQDSFQNLALEELLLDLVEPGDCVLYLWQNQRTVVIGHNQNPWKECRVALLEQEGGRLARRLSGGGAVFHDLGNLNFTFLVSKEDYDLSRQLSVLETACGALGIPVVRSGRNDLLAAGKKFSGSAFYSHKGRAYHHGTLMVEVDLDRVTRYLSPSRAKLEAKGVDSVRSRVVNLRDLAPSLTVETLADCLEKRFQEVYGLTATRLEPGQLDQARLAELTAHYGGQDWRFGRSLPFTLQAEERFPWGGVELLLKADRGVIQAAQIFTDAMDPTLAPGLEAALAGIPLRGPELRAALDRLPLEPRQRGDLLGLLYAVV